MMDRLKKQYRDVYGYAVLLDIVRFKEEMEHARWKQFKRDNPEI